MANFRANKKRPGQNPAFISSGEEVLFAFTVVGTEADEAESHEY